MAERARAQIVRQQVERYATLTPRERQVLREVARGRVNKQIAFDLGISEITVKLHRGNLMRKMHAGSVGDIIRAWEALPADLRDKEADLDFGMVSRPCEIREVENWYPGHNQTTQQGQCVCPNRPSLRSLKMTQPCVKLFRTSWRCLSLACRTFECAEAFLAAFRPGASTV